MNFVTEIRGQSQWCSALRGSGTVLSAVHDVQDNLKCMMSWQFSPAASATRRSQSAAESNPAWQGGVIPVLQTSKQIKKFKGKNPIDHKLGKSLETNRILYLNIFKNPGQGDFSKVHRAEAASRS